MSEIQKTEFLEKFGFPGTPAGDRMAAALAELVNPPIRYGLVCRGCGCHCPVTPDGMKVAERHDREDECGRFKDREAEGWYLEVFDD